MVLLGCSAVIRGDDVASQTVDLNGTPPTPQPTICGDIVSDNIYQDQYWFFASDVIACLTSVPFHPEVASRFITYFNETMQFQSTLAYLKNPPSTYQQPALDFQARLQQIQDRVNADFYHNQYAFEADLQALSQATHDSHAVLPFNLVTVSSDGKQIPEIYFHDDLLACNGQHSNCTVSAVKSINNVPVVDYLTSFAQNNSFGMIEPHADWNNLMDSPAQDIIDGTNAFSGGATFYDGDTINVAWKNGTEHPFYWLALYNSPGFTGPLTTGGDFYNYFVLGNPPANYDEELQKYYASFPPDNSTDLDTDPDPLLSWNSVSPAYPNNTLTRQQYLGSDTSGIITSYYLEDIKTAVLSIPSFTEYGTGIDTFSSAVSDFTNAASENNATKIIIDLQQNSGGQVSLAFDTFRQFFPHKTPYAGSRLRSHEMANAIGNTLTAYFQSLDSADEAQTYFDALYEEWVVTPRLNAETGQNFSSWAEFYGPQHFSGDDFSLTQRYNLSSQLFDESDLGIDFPDCYFDNSCDDSTLWQGKDIILLTDGLCASACTLFVEMMTHDAGAQTVVVGGRPEPGPMQAASGSRGARSYSSDELDGDFATTVEKNASAGNQLPQVRDPGMLITYFGFTLKDQIRPSASTPNQFLYLPADCRIYWTFANVNDYGRLWRDVWNARYNDTSICVPGSAGVTAPAKNTANVRQKRATPATDVSIGEYIEQGLSPSTWKNHSGVPDLDITSKYSKPLTFCRNNKGGADPSLCTNGYTCQVVYFACTNQVCKGRQCTASNGNVHYFVCLRSCLPTSNTGGNCMLNEYCEGSTSTSSKKNSGGNLQDPQPRYDINGGYCYPSLVSKPPCSYLKQQQSNLQAAIDGGLSKR
ncbi:MAG: hypothetical protein M1821_007169 [Bathelium mastoideum]|nr:MAG: hypothetical protein M1821_007169 [Bathelium mastoideum]